MQAIRVAVFPFRTQSLSFSFLWLVSLFSIVNALGCRHTTSNRITQNNDDTKSSSSSNSVASQLAQSLPSASGADVAFFRVTNSSDAPLTLLTYFPSTLLQNQNSLLQTAKVKRAVVVVHGIDTDADTSFTAARNSLKKATKIDPSISEDSVAIMAPFFGSASTAGLRKRHSGGSSGKSGGTGIPSSLPDVLLWSGADWASGTRNSDFSDARDVSSYDALDQILQYFDNKQRYPSMNQIMIVGHSAGGQMVQRYAAVGRELNLTTPVRYWIGNPNSFVFMNSSRPLSTKDCPTFNDWRNGLDTYTNTYEQEFVTAGAKTGAVLDRWYSRDIALARGLDDEGDQSTDCGPNTTGANRDERFLNFMTFVPPNLKQTVDYINASHDAEAMFSSDAGLSRLFFDNFYGDSSRAADFGERRIDVDNPHPNDSFISNTPRPGSNSTTTSSTQLSNLPRRVVRKRTWRALSDFSIKWIENTT